LPQIPEISCQLEPILIPKYINSKVAVLCQLFAFTDHGILMLSNVLKSQRAIEVSIQIIKVFNKMRHILVDYKKI